MSKSTRVTCVIGRVKDIFGEEWGIHERRPTPHGFSMAFGWPIDLVPGPGRPSPSRPAAILTRPLARYLKATPRAGDIDLPVSVHVQVRFRKLLGVDRSTTTAAWWRKHIAELERIGDRAFAEKYGLHTVSVGNKRRELIGPSYVRRPPSWCESPRIAKVLLTRPVDESAARYGLHRRTVSRYRSRLRELGLS